MRARIKTPVIGEGAKTGSIKEACARYGIGKDSMRRVAEDAGAVIRIGRRYLVNFAKVDMYMNSISQ